MDLSKVLGYTQKVLGAAGSVVDAAVPFAVGNRTKASVVIATLAPVVGKGACSVYPPLCPFISVVGSLAATLAPVFALAGFARSSS